MKKSILLLTFILFFSFVLSFSCYATDLTVTFSDDYETLYLNGYSYSRANTSLVYGEMYGEGELFTSNLATYIPDGSSYDALINIQLTNEQESELSRVYVYTKGKDHLFVATEIYFKNGMTIWVDFVRDDIKEVYNTLINGNTEKFKISYDSFSEEIIERDVSKNLLLTGNKTIIDYWDITDEFDVIAESKKHDFSVIQGILLIKENQYYYFDYKENGICYSEELYDCNIDKIEVHKITDSEAIEQIENGLQAYYDADYGYLYNDKLTETVAKIFFAFIFAVVPAVVFVVSLIFAVKSKKGLYKKLLFTTSGVSVAVIITFIYIAYTLFNT